MLPEFMNLERKWCCVIIPNKYGQCVEKLQRQEASWINSKLEYPSRFSEFIQTETKSNRDIYVLK